MEQKYKVKTVQMTPAVNPSNSASITPNVINFLQDVFYQTVNWMTPYSTRKVVVVGNGVFAQKLLRFFQSNRAYGYEVCGYYDVNPSTPGVQGGLEDLKKYCQENEVDEIYYTRPVSQESVWKDLAEFADKNFIYFRLAQDPQKAVQAEKGLTVSYVGNIPVMKLRKEPLASRFNQGVKRAFDILFSLAVLAILIPFVFPIIALAIYIEDPGPIFFVQKRPGKKNQLFKCFKFRSMRVNNDSEKQATKNDSRITKVGAFIRKTSLDELPQFMNVLLGDMSVVGPRPNMVKQLEFYSQHIDNYSFRHFVTPGITGYAQVNGFRGETKTMDLMEKRVDYDIQYMEKWSLWFDLKIIFLTGWNIIAGEENAY